VIRQSLRLRDPRHVAPGIAAFTAAMAVALLGLHARADTPTSEAATPSGAVKLRLLGVNDFHGHLEPPEPDVGGAAWLTGHLDAAVVPGHTIRVHAGDMVGASPLISSWFHDEPSIEAANLMGFDVGTVGNHEFDEGGDELLRLIRGGRRSGPGALKPDGDGGLVNTSSPGFKGAAFPYVAANTVDRETGRLVLPPYRVVERAGVRVGFIGVTTPSTPHWVLPRFADRFRFLDISDSVNRWVRELQRRGVQAIVVLAHSGAPSQEGDGARATGEVVEESREMSDAVDVVIAGHSHSVLNLRVPNPSGRGHKLVVEADSYGTAFDRVDMTVDRRSGDVVRKSASISPTPHSGVAADPESAALVARYARRIAPVGGRVVGRASRDMSAEDGLGTLAAAAQRRLAGSDVAFVNRGSFRGSVEDGPITYGELFEAQAYDHPVLKLTMSGADVLAVARHAAVYAAGVEGGPPIEPSRRYTVAVNELFATRGGIPSLEAAVPAGHPVGTEVEALSRFVEQQHRALGAGSP
jgi:5'-nucleotidase